MKTLKLIAALAVVLSGGIAQAGTATGGTLPYVATQTTNAYMSQNITNTPYGGTNCQNGTGSCTNKMTTGFVLDSSDGYSAHIGQTQLSGVSQTPGGVVDYSSPSGCSSSTYTCSSATVSDSCWGCNL